MGMHAMLLGLDRNDITRFPGDLDGARRRRRRRYDLEVSAEHRLHEFKLF